MPLWFNDIKRSGVNECCCINDLEIHILLIKSIQQKYLNSSIFSILTILHPNLLLRVNRTCVKGSLEKYVLFQTFHRDFVFKHEVKCKFLSTTSRFYVYFLGNIVGQTHH